MFRGRRETGGDRGTTEEEEVEDGAEAFGETASDMGSHRWEIELCNGDLLNLGV